MTNPSIEFLIVDTALPIILNGAEIELITASLKEPIALVIGLSIIALVRVCNPGTLRPALLIPLMDLATSVMPFFISTLISSCLFSDFLLDSSNCLTTSVNVAIGSYP